MCGLLVCLIRLITLILDELQAVDTYIIGVNHRAENVPPTVELADIKPREDHD